MSEITRVEHTLGATVEIVSAEVVGLRTYLDDRFAAVDARFDHQDRMLDALATEVQVEFDRHQATLDGHGAKLDSHSVKLDEQAAKLDGYGAKLDTLQAGFDVLLDHFGLEPPR